MKPLKNITFLAYGLILLLSLISFSGIINESLPKITQTELVINDTKQSKRFTIQFYDVNKAVLISFFNYYHTSFNTFKTSQNLKDTISFKTYTCITRSIISERIKSKFHTSFYQKIIYEDSIV